MIKWGKTSHIKIHFFTRSASELVQKTFPVEVILNYELYMIMNLRML